MGRGGTPYSKQAVYQLPAQTHPQQNAMENDVVTHGLASTRIMPGAPRYHTGSSRSLWLDLLLLLFPRGIAHLALSSPVLLPPKPSVVVGEGQGELELGFELGLISGSGLKTGLGIELL
jgi:hypothetical protein